MRKKKKDQTSQDLGQLQKAKKKNVAKNASKLEANRKSGLRRRRTQQQDKNEQIKKLKNRVAA